MTREELDEPLRDQIIALIEKARDQDNTASELADAIRARLQHDREAIRKAALEEAAQLVERAPVDYEASRRQRDALADRDDELAKAIRLLISGASATQSEKEGA